MTEDIIGNIDVKGINLDDLGNYMRMVQDVMIKKFQQINERLRILEKAVIKKNDET